MASRWMVRAYEHGHERSRTRPRLDHAPINAMPVGPPPRLNVPNFNRVATLRRFVIVARGARCGPHLSSVAARTAVRDSSGVRLCTYGIGAGRRCAGSTAVAGCRLSFSGDLPPPAASERGKQPQSARPRGPSDTCRYVRAQIRETERRRRSAPDAHRSAYPHVVASATMPPRRLSLALARERARVRGNRHRASDRSLRVTTRRDQAA